jgi:hypothetical protein
LQREDTKESIRATSKTLEIIALEIFAKNDWRNNSRLCIWFSLNLVNFYLAKFWNSIHCGINSIKKRHLGSKYPEVPPPTCGPYLSSTPTVYPIQIPSGGSEPVGGYRRITRFTSLSSGVGTGTRLCQQGNKRQWREHVAF